jgi:hypothetical protein
MRWLVAAVCLVLPSIAEAQTAEQLIKQAETAYSEGDFERALKLLESAEEATSDRAVLGAVFKQQGLLQEILQRPELSTLAFLRGLRCDAGITLNPREHKRSVLSVFDFARALLHSGADIERLGAQLGRGLTRDRTACADLAPPAAPANPSAGAQVAVEPAGPGWPVWVLGATTVAAAGAGLVFGVLASSKDNECRGLTSLELWRSCDSSASSLELGANVLFAAAGVAGLSATGLWLFGSR